MPTRYSALAGGLLVSLPMLLSASPGRHRRPGNAASIRATSNATRPTGPNPARSAMKRRPTTIQARSAAAYPAPRSNDAYPPRFGRQLPRTTGIRRAPAARTRRWTTPTARRAPATTCTLRRAIPTTPMARRRVPATPRGLVPTDSPIPRPRRPMANLTPRRQAPDTASPTRRRVSLPASPMATDRPNDPPPAAMVRPLPIATMVRLGPRYDDDVADGSYSSREILQAGHGFFGSVSKGLASVVEYAFQKQGRPNGYILGQDAGGAFVAGLRYGEGMLYTKDAGSHRVYWQGPSIGWDAGAEGSKVMVLVYNLRDPEEIYQRFGGVDGSAYLVGGVGVTFLTSSPVIVAPIRSASACDWAPTSATSSTRAGRRGTRFEARIVLLCACNSGMVRDGARVGLLVSVLCESCHKRGAPGRIGLQGLGICAKALNMRHLCQALGRAVDLDSVSHADGPGLPGREPARAAAWRRRSGRGRCG